MIPPRRGPLVAVLLFTSVAAIAPQLAPRAPAPPQPTGTVITGNASPDAPHLHFAVQVNRGMKLVSIPFRMTGVTDRP